MRRAVARRRRPKTVVAESLCVSISRGSLSLDHVYEVPGGCALTARHVADGVPGIGMMHLVFFPRS